MAISKITVNIFNITTLTMIQSRLVNHTVYKTYPKMTYRRGLDFLKLWYLLQDIDLEGKCNRQFCPNMLEWSGFCREAKYCSMSKHHCFQEDMSIRIVRRQLPRCCEKVNKVIFWSFDNNFSNWVLPKMANYCVTSFWTINFL